MTSEKLEIWSLESAANELQVNVQTLRNLIRRGELQACFIGKKYWIKVTV